MECFLRTCCYLTLGKRLCTAYKCCKRNRSFLKIIATGSLTFGTIVGVFNFFTNLKQIFVYPDHKYNGVILDSFNTYGRIRCTPDTNSNDTRSTCNSMAQTMLNLSSNYTDFDCYQHADFSNSNETVLSTFSIVEEMFQGLLIVSILYAFFAMLHDMALIYYPRELERYTIEFYPTTAQRDHPFSSKFLKKVFSAFDEICKKICCNIVIGILCGILFGIVLFALFEVACLVWAVIGFLELVCQLLICPIVCCVCDGWSQWKNYRQNDDTDNTSENNSSDNSADNKCACDKCVYVSSIWVG